ncbi:hypothetical protein [Actinokineospora globicatena]|uniref:hypothetical protein n=1 Tax=Actinokineospora globicatena TaxID=103729 RepID=UPI0020A46D45|nr:hypothetical protein [Actinokineospora globicatena]MCP2303849.1 hypothetical protein [Actinokineospora globicatena]
MCGDQSEYMYGVFVTFAFPTPTYSAPAPFGSADFYNETEFFTDDAMTKSFAFGLDMRYSSTGTVFQPYWVDYSNDYVYHNVGTALSAPDGRLHTFMAIPSCDNCSTWDVFYDFAKVGTTGGQPGPSSHHLMTGWLLSGMSGQMGLSATSNRVMYLNGNYQFQRFGRSAVTSRAPAGNCSPGANPKYCFRFDTAITTSPGTGENFVVSWDVTKPMVSPGLVAHPAPTSGGAGLDDTASLEQRAQRLVDAHLGGKR